MIQPEMIAFPFILLVFHALAKLWAERPRFTTSFGLWLQALLGAVLASLAAGWIWAISPLFLGWMISLFDSANAPTERRRWFIETGSIGLISFAAILAWVQTAASIAGIDFKIASVFAFGNGWANSAIEASRRDLWTLILVPVALYPWICWKTLWRALSQHLRETLGTGFRLSLAFLIVVAFLGLASGWKLLGMLPIAAPLSLLGARLLATQAIRPKDFHALVPGFFALFLGLFFFLMNIIPTAHLDALWREIFGISLPIWIGGIGLVSGLALLAIAYGLSQMSPSEQISRTLQVALFPIVLMTSLNLEFATNLKPFFDLRPIATRLNIIQDAGRPVAIFGPYSGEFDFVGRLHSSPTLLPSRNEAAKWAHENPGGVIVTYFDGSPIRLPALPLYRGVARDRFVAIWPASAIKNAKSNLLNDQF